MHDSDDDGASTALTDSDSDSDDDSDDGCASLVLTDSDSDSDSDADADLCAAACMPCSGGSTDFRAFWGMAAHPAEPAGSSPAQDCDVALMTQESPVTRAPQLPETDPPGDRFYRRP